MDDKSISRRRFFVCEVHRKPVKYLATDGVNSFHKHKLNVLCEDCIHELKILSSASKDTPDNFLSTDNLHCFVHPIKTLKQKLELKQNSIKSSLSSFDRAVENTIEFLNQFKEKVTEKLHHEFSAISNHLSKLTSRHKQYQQLMQELLQGSSESTTLQQAIEIYSELSAETKSHGAPDFTYPIQTQISVQKCTEQLSELKTRLEEYFRTLEPHFNVQNAIASPVCNSVSSRGRPERTRPKSVSTTRRPSTRMSGQQFTTLETFSERIEMQPNFMRDTLDSFQTLSSMRESRYSNNTAKTTREHTPTVSPRLTWRRNTKSPLTQRIRKASEDTSLTLSIAPRIAQLSCHYLETKMKIIDTLTYIPKIKTLAYAGCLKGQQFHSIVFYKLSSSPKISKIVDAHSHKITALYACNNIMISCSKDALAKVWDLTTLECQMVLKHTSAVFGAAFDSRKNIVFTFGMFSNIRVWNLDQMTDYFIKAPITNQVSHLYYLESREWLLTADKDNGRINILDYSTESAVYTYVPTDQCVYNEVQFDYETSQIITISNEGLLKVWKLTETTIQVERVLILKEKGGQSRTNLAVDLKHELIFISNSSDNLWIGKLTDGESDGILNWVETGVKNIRQILYMKKQKWVLVTNRIDGKIAIIQAEKVKETFPELK